MTRECEIRFNADASSAIHGENESLHVDDWRKLIESEVHLLAEVAATWPTR